MAETLTVKIQTIGETEDKNVDLYTRTFENCIENPVTSQVQRDKTIQGYVNRHRTSRSAKWVLLKSKTPPLKGLYNNGIGYATLGSLLDSFFAKTSRLTPSKSRSDMFRDDLSGRTVAYLVPLEHNDTKSSIMKEQQESAILWCIIKHLHSFFKFPITVKVRTTDMYAEFPCPCGCDVGPFTAVEGSFCELHCEYHHAENKTLLETNDSKQGMVGVIGAFINKYTFNNNLDAQVKTILTIAFGFIPVGIVVPVTNSCEDAAISPLCTVPLSTPPQLFTYLSNAFDVGMASTIWHYRAQIIYAYCKKPASKGKTQKHKNFDVIANLVNRSNKQEIEKATVLDEEVKASINKAIQKLINSNIQQKLPIMTTDNAYSLLHQLMFMASQLHEDDEITVETDGTSHRGKIIRIHTNTKPHTYDIVLDNRMETTVGKPQIKTINVEQKLASIYNMEFNFEQPVVDIIDSFIKKTYTCNDDKQCKLHSCSPFTKECIDMACECSDFTATAIHNEYIRGIHAGYNRVKMIVATITTCTPLVLPPYKLLSSYAYTETEETAVAFALNLSSVTNTKARFGLKV